MNDHDWSTDAVCDVEAALMRGYFTADEAALAISALAGAFPASAGPWNEQIRALAEACNFNVKLMGKDPRLHDWRALRATLVLCNRRLGIGLYDGVDVLRPLQGLVAVLDLPEETIKAVSALAVEGHTRSPGWFIARVVALPEPPPPGIQVGDKVLVEDRCAPDGAGFIPSEEFGNLPPGGRVIFVPCRRLPTAHRSEELAERLKDVQAFKAKYPPSQFPQSHSLWKSPEGEALLAQQGEHVFQMRNIMASRKGCARNRLVKAGKDDATLPDGIIGVIECDHAVLECDCFECECRGVHPHHSTVGGCSDSCSWAHSLGRKFYGATELGPDRVGLHGRGSN